MIRKDRNSPRNVSEPPCPVNSSTISTKLPTTMTKSKMFQRSEKYPRAESPMTLTTASITNAAVR